MAFTIDRNLNKTYLFCILQYANEKVWIKLEEPCLYQDFVQKGFFFFLLYFFVLLF